LKAAREQAEAAAAEADTLRQQVQAGMAEAESLRAQLRTAAGEADSLRAEVSASAADLEALRTEVATAIAEADALRQQGASAAAQLESLEAASVSQTAELESLRAVSVAQATELDSLRAALTSQTADLDSVRALAASQTADLDSVRAVAAAQAAELESLRAGASAATGELDAARQRALALAAERDALREQAETLQAELHTLRDRAQADGEKAARVDGADAALATMRAELEEAQAIADAASAEMTAARERTRKSTALLATTASALAALDLEGTVAGVFSSLVRQLRTEFARTAIFRMKGGHLEGEVAAGVDSSVDVTKIVIPKGLGSIIARAATGTTVQVATKDEIAEARPPFGGTPVSALAAPLVFEGETIAVLYADADTPFTDAHAPLATVFMRHVNARLGLLAQELKVASRLREYARTLLHELEEMAATDVTAGTNAKDRLRRLRDSLGFARDLYAQRAALEAPTAADVLEEEIAALIDTDARTPFARDLAALVVESRGAARNAS
jgi:uncharacterized coiled-coil DUF342 family protein